MKIPLPQRLVLMPRSLSWWVWAITVVCLAAGLMRYSFGFYAAIISVTQTVVYDLKQTSALAFPVQIRFAYTILLILCQVPSLGWLYWVPTVGTFALVLFGYCLMARILSLPWEPHRADQRGSYPADVSDAAGRIRSRRADREPFRPYKG